MSNSVNQRIQALQAQMQKADLAAYIIPSSDPHQSEYFAAHWKSRRWISGFTGSAGIAVITADHAGLWTDSRYFLQAEEELANSLTVLHKQGIPHAPEHIEWLCQNLPAGSKVGCDGKLFSLGQINRLGNALKKKGIILEYHHDLIDLVWKNRPALPDTKIFEHEVHYAGQTREEKIQAIRKEMQDQGADFCLLTTLDDIAWTLNLRGSDVECNPVFIAYALIGLEQVDLFIEAEKVPPSLHHKLSTEGINFRAYKTVEVYIEALEPKQGILVDKDTINVNLYDCIDSSSVIQGSNIPRALKAIKNPVEVEHIRAAMLKDGVALTRLYRWLDRTLDEKEVTEVEVAQKLSELRAAQGDYHGESFDAIVGYKGNGAIVHYHPMPKTCAKLKKEGILLLDSGGQYTNGTTDITRTTALGTPTEEQKRNFTLVLKGHIALARLHFPEGTKGIQMDTMARQYLWQQHLDYGHGTGHGVGFFMNVHEPPQGFATSVSQRGVTVFKEGMFTSNEPGFYKTGEYGIRIENLILTNHAEETPYGNFLKFETLTLFPIDLQLVESALLQAEEKEWLNQYHQEVCEKLTPLLKPDEAAWMKEQCRAI